MVVYEIGQGSRPFFYHSAGRAGRLANLNFGRLDDHVAHGLWVPLLHFDVLCLTLALAPHLLRGHTHADNGDTSIPSAR